MGGVVYIEIDFVDNRGKNRRHSLAMTRIFNEEYQQKIFQDVRHIPLNSV